VSERRDHESVIYPLDEPALRNTVLENPITGRTAVAYEDLRPIPRVSIFRHGSGRHFFCQAQPRPAGLNQIPDYFPRPDASPRQ
jgi:hypothetical protein